MFLIPDRVAGMCKSRSCTDMGFTILAIRCRGSTEKVCQFVKHVIACYPNQAGWEVSTQQVRALMFAFHTWARISISGSALSVVVN